MSEVGGLLLQFKVKNYRSIGDEVVLDLTAGSGKEHSDFLIELKKGINILPIISMYGGNASGKSNIINAMGSMIFDVKSSHSNGERDDTRINVNPFVFNDKLKNEPTELEMFFTVGKHEYQYGYKTTTNKIYEEWLYRRTLSIRATKEEVIFEREGNKVVFGNKYLKSSSLLNRLKERNLALSVLGAWNASKMFSDIFEWFNENLHFHVNNIDYGSVKTYFERFDGLKDSFVKFLQEFDPLIKDLAWREATDVDGKVRMIPFSKRDKGEFHFANESEGTQRLLRIYTIFYIALNEMRSTLVYDELDAHLHPLMLRRIVSMFHNKEINKMGSQLIFTSHNLILLDNRELRRDEIWFVEKDERGFTNAYAMDSFKGRSDLDYLKNYLSGRFGAIPFAIAGVQK
ncbi:MAG: ATP-binding protein [Defluviitaleaceae bacterium]|nr:ATP-binding protein [Defluviitaleaceae bacterium]